MLNMILGMFLLLSGIFLLMPPFYFYHEFIIFIKGFIPIFFIFTGLILLLIEIFINKKNKKEKDKEEK